jgi:hypothetical protein
MLFVYGRLSGIRYNPDHDFTDAGLTAVTPLYVCRYIRLKAFGAEFPSPDANPIATRHATIAFNKKAISFFMPNREKWSATRTEGNPTQSKESSKVLGSAKAGCKINDMTSNGWKGISEYANFLHEAGGNGKRTTTHPFLWKRYGISAMVKFQFHLIAQIDDSTQVIFEHIHVHEKFAHALKARLNWSKNVQDKRDAPFQIVLESLDPMYCVLCSLALWLELNLKMYPSVMELPCLFCFCDDYRIPDKGKKAKLMIQLFLTKMFKKIEFQGDEGNAKQMLLGSHSISKIRIYILSCVRYPQR